jgi:hypothetical protein
MTTIKQEGELKMTNNKNVFAERIFLDLNGFNVVMNKNVEDPIGIILNVLGLIPKTFKVSKTIILILHVNFARKNKLMRKVEGVSLGKETEKMKVGNDYYRRMF